MTENIYRQKIPAMLATDMSFAWNTRLVSIILLSRFGMAELTDYNYIGRDISVRESSIEHGTYSADSSYFEALMELANAERELTEALSAEYKFLLENQTDGDPEIDAIISENLVDLL